MQIEKLVVGPFQCNCSVLGCETTREAVIVDPGDEPELIISLVKSKGWKPKYLIHTHAHLDHVGGTLGVQEKLGGESCLHKEDLFLFENVAAQAALFNLPPPPTGKIDQFIGDGDILKFGEYKIEVFHTPGHTPGSVSFYLPGGKTDQVFTGDTLFMRSIGRTDLWGGDYDLILKSIREKLLPLGDKTIVHAGHGPNSTIGAERSENPFLQ
jgi:glyoxylase-like metal-dependent hydrolase (beta-lactamase superfamily II)